MTVQYAKQDRVWLESEGDQWFKRNATVLRDSQKFDWVDYLLKMVPDKSAIRRVAELGCSNGWRLENLRKQWPIDTLVGVDASSEAIEDGKKQYPELRLYQGLLADLPFEETFDLVIVAGVFCLVDRAALAKSVAEVDRVIEDGGLLLIGDFLPDFPQRRKWHHDPSGRIHTYKQNYVALFEGFGTYKELVRIAIDADDPYSQGVKPCDGQSRYGFSLLQKSLTGFYYPVQAE